jgi:hypothetical protein
MRLKNKVVKKGLTALQLSVLSESLLNFVSDYHGDRDSLIACACACLSQVKIKCDKTLASGVVKEKYKLKLSDSEKYALMYMNNIVVNQSSPMAHNAIVLLLKSV